MNFNSIPLDNYSFGKIELDDFQLSNLNLIISKLSQTNKMSFDDSFGIEWEFSLVGLIDYLFHKIGDQGPFLIISKNYQKWVDLISNIDGIIPVIYRGTPQERESIRNKQMFNPDNTIKFNILICASDLSEIDYSAINKVFYQLSIFHNWKFKTVKYMPKSNKMIRYTQNYRNAFLYDLITIDNFTKESYYDDPIPERKQEKIENFENLLTYIPSEPLLKSPQYYYIDCPLSKIQKVVLKKLIFQSEPNFSSLCQVILRVCSHPFLVFGIESLLGPVNYIESSTKLSVFSKLITDKLTDAKKILVISQFNGMLDLIEDFATEKEIMFDRLIDRDIAYENKDSKLLLYNPLYCNIDIITEFIDYFVIIDGDHSAILNTLLSKPNRKLKAIITLQCQELFETRLTKTCMHGLNINNKVINNNTNNNSNTGSPHPSANKTRTSSSSSSSSSLEFQYSYIFSGSQCHSDHHDDSQSQFNDFMCEVLCKIAAAASLSPVKPFTIDSIIENISKEPIETASIFDIQFCQASNFWEVLMNTPEYQTKTEFPLVQSVVDDGKHNWTLRERDQLIRGLISFGWDRWDDIINNGGLHQLSKDSIIKISRSLLRFLLQFHNRKLPYPLIKQFIRESSSYGPADEKADLMSLEKEDVFNQPDFKKKMKLNADRYLKRFESLSYLRQTVEPYIDNISSLQIGRTIGNSPTINWTEDYDRILLIGSYRYGFGSYDHFPEDQDPNYREVAFCAEQSLLNDTLLKQTENFKRKYDAGFRNPTHEINSESENSDNFDDSYNNNNNLNTRKAKAQSSDNDDNDDIDDSNVRSNLSCHWSKEEANQILKFMCDNGIINDFEIMRKESHLDNKTAEQVKEYIDNYMERIKLKPEEGGIKAKNGIKRRVQAMDELRSILNFELQYHPDLYRFQGGNRKSRPKNDDSDDDGDFDGEAVHHDVDNTKLFEKVPHWKKLPPSWTPNVERFFFTELAIKGFGAIKDILSICEKKRFFDSESLPSFVVKFDSLFKRIHAIFELNPYLAQTQNRQNPYFYKFQQTFLQQEQKMLQSPPAKVTRKLNPMPEINRNPEIDQITENNRNLNEAPNSEQKVKIRLKPLSESKPIDKKTVKKANKEKSGENSKEGSAKESSEYSENDQSDYDDEYKSRNVPRLSQVRRASSRPVASKEVLKESHKEQVKQAQIKLKQKQEKPKVKAAPIVDFSIDDFTFPFPITSTSYVLNIGEIIYDRPAFHSERYIYPAGYKSVKAYASIDNPETRANYISEIIDNGSEAPIFRVTMEGTSHVFEGSTPTAPWTNVLKEVFSQGTARRGYSVSGPEAFMFAQPKVLFLIQMLPNADKCTKYVPKSVPPSVLNELSKISKRSAQGQNGGQNQGQINNEKKVEEKVEVEEVRTIETVETVPENIEDEKPPVTATTVTTTTITNVDENNAQKETVTETIISTDVTDQSAAVVDVVVVDEKVTEESVNNEEAKKIPQKRNVTKYALKKRNDYDYDINEGSEFEDESDDDYEGSAYEEKVTKVTSRSSPRSRPKKQNVNNEKSEEEGIQEQQQSSQAQQSPKPRVTLKARQKASNVADNDDSGEYISTRVGRRTQNRKINYNTDDDDYEKENDKSNRPSELNKKSVNYKQEEEEESEDDDDDDDGSAYEERNPYRPKSATRQRYKRKNTKESKINEAEHVVQNENADKREVIEVIEVIEDDGDVDDDDESPYEERVKTRPAKRTYTRKSSENKNDDDEQIKSPIKITPRISKNEDDVDNANGEESESESESDSNDPAYGKKPPVRNQSRKAHNRGSSARKESELSSSDEFGEKKKRKVKSTDDKSVTKVNRNLRKRNERNINEIDNDGNDDEFDDDSDSFDDEYVGGGRRTNQRRKKK